MRNTLHTIKQVGDCQGAVVGVDGQSEDVHTSRRRPGFDSQVLHFFVILVPTNHSEAFVPTNHSEHAHIWNMTLDHVIRD